MNILILNWRGPGHPNAGGAEIVTHEYAKAWVKAGYNVTLFSSVYQGSKEREIYDGIEIIRKGRAVFGVQIRACLWYIFSKHPSFDLVIDQFHGIPFFTPLYVKTRKLAFIHETAKTVWKLNPWPKPFHLIPYIIGTIGEPWIFRLYKKVPFLTVSASTKHDLIEWHIPAKHITVIHNGVTIPDFRLNSRKEEKKTILFLGALAKDKGIEDALKSFSIIHALKPDWQFWIAGHGEPTYMEELKGLVKQLHIDNVIFWGYVSEKKKFELLAKAHLLINPSIREGWGLVNIEANAVGTPVAAYDVAGCRDSIRNNETGILVSFGKHDKLADAMIALLTDEKRYAYVREHALSWSKQFTWEKAAGESLKLIDSLIHS